MVVVVVEGLGGGDRRGVGAGEREDWVVGRMVEFYGRKGMVE